MSSRKEQELKQFLISERKKIGPGLTNAPVWVLQKAGKRIWNPKAHRHWKEVGLGDEFRKRKKNLVKRKPGRKRKKTKKFYKRKTRKR